MSEDYGRGLDPVPAEWRRADPERDARARELESQITFAIHFKFDEPEGEGDPFEERVHYVYGPPREGGEHSEAITSGDARLDEERRRIRELVEDPRSSQGFISKGAGVWWYRPPFREVETTYGDEAIPQDQLEVNSEEEAKTYARRRVAWKLAGE